MVYNNNIDKTIRNEPCIFLFYIRPQNFISTILYNRSVYIFMHLRQRVHALRRANGRNTSIEIFRNMLLKFQYLTVMNGKRFMILIENYIRNQLEQDQISEQISLKEFVDPFTGSKNHKAYY